MLILINISGGIGSFGLFFIELNFESNVIRYEKSFKWHKNAFLDLDFPPHRR